MTPPALKITLEDADRAGDAWGANCGPAAIAAIMGVTLEDVRPYLGDFERKGYVNSTMMFETLERLHKRRGLFKGFRGAKYEWPTFGLMLIQWDGPWMLPEVPAGARYNYTHWIASIAAAHIFDINSLSNGMGWVDLDIWKSIIVPYVTSRIPRASGNWQIAHSIEIFR